MVRAIAGRELFVLNAVVFRGYSIPECTSANTKPPRAPCAAGRGLSARGQTRPGSARIEGRSCRSVQTICAQLSAEGKWSLIQGDADAALEDWTRALDMDKPRTERVLGIHEAGFGETAVEQLPDSLRHQMQAIVPQLRRLRPPCSGPDELWHSHFFQPRMAVCCRETRKRPPPKAAHLAKTCVEAGVLKALESGQYSDVSGCFAPDIDSEFIPRSSHPDCSSTFRTWRI